MTYTKTIEMQFERVSNRTRLTGFIGELRDGNILLHSQEYSTNSQAEQALDRIVFDLLTDLAERGLVDDVPAALEAEMVSSTHLPSWLLEAQARVDACTQAHPCDNVNHNHTGYRTPQPACQNCQGPHHTWQCPQIGDLLFAEPVVVVPDDDLGGPGGIDLYAAAFEIDDQPDLIAEAGILVNKIEEMQFDLCADYEAEGRFPPSVMAHHQRLCRILAKAERRLQRREFAELGGVDFTPPDVEFAPFGFAA